MRTRLLLLQLASAFIACAMSSSIDASGAARLAAEQRRFAELTGVGLATRATHADRRPRAPARRARPSACESARADRDKALQAAGLHRTYDLIRSTNDRVFAACQHF